MLRGLGVLLVTLVLAVACAPSGGGGAGDASRGRTLFESKQCVTCHVLASIPNATGTIGPSLNGIGTTAATRKPGMAAEAYMRESIKDPSLFIVPGFAGPPSAMVLPVPVNDQEISDLIAFLLTQK